jgi:hypothetical protein
MSLWSSSTNHGGNEVAQSFQWEFGCARPETLGEGIAFGLFLFTSFQAALLFPDVTLIPQERAKLFPGILAGLSLAAAILLGNRSSASWTKAEIAVSAVLAALVGLSGLMSETWESSSLRGFVVITSGLGGFWCARILLRSPGRQWFFVGFCAALLFLIGLVGLFGYFHAGDIIAYLDVNPHPLASRMLLLSFAPIALIMLRRTLPAVVGLCLLVLSYSIFLFSNLRSAALIPIILALIAAAYRVVRLRYILIAFIPVMAALAFFFSHLPEIKRGLALEYEPAYYRIENYPFSLHVALKHPWLGIGLRAPRDSYLADYEMKYPYVTKEMFADSVRRIVTSENTYLNFMVDVGFPFLVLYLACLGWLFLNLIRASRTPVRFDCIPPLAILLSLTAGALHFLVLDGLLHPHVSWFFHVLLGLIPTGEAASDLR